MDALNPAALMEPTTDSIALTALQNRMQTGPQATSLQGETPNFESLLLSMMVKEMRQSMGSELFPGDTSDIFGSMFDMHLGDHMAEFAKLGMNDTVMASIRSQQAALERQTTAPAAASSDTTTTTE